MSRSLGLGRDDLLIILGVELVTVGIGLVALPLAFIFAGTAIAGLGWIIGRN